MVSTSTVTSRTVWEGAMSSASAELGGCGADWQTADAGRVPDLTLRKWIKLR
ncbi:hypothetical protein ACLK19_00915 [Escherichia coli]